MASRLRRTSPRGGRAVWLWVALVIATLAASGCGYTATRTLHDPKYRTIAIPIFKNRTFYREFEFRLTEELKKVVESRTPYKVVDRGADTTLLGEIVDVRQVVVARDVASNPTERQLDITVRFEWKDNATGEVILLVPGFHEVESSRRGFGEPLDDVVGRAVVKLAERIVERMEAAW